MKKILIKYIFSFITLIIFFNLIITGTLISQEIKTKSYTPYATGDIAIGAGLTILKVVNDNPSKQAIYNQGGSFGGAQTGFDLRITYNIGESSDFCLPIGISNYFFEGKEKVPVATYYTFRFSNSLNILSPYIGLQYYFAKLPLGGAKTYISYNFVGNFIYNHIYEVDEINTLNPNPPTSKYTTYSPRKINTFRLGNDLRVGIVGKLQDKYEINVSAGYSITNLLLKDNKRGELLTAASSIADSQESLLSNFIFTLMIQYRY